MDQSRSRQTLTSFGMVTCVVDTDGSLAFPPFMGGTPPPAAVPFKSFAAALRSSEVQFRSCPFTCPFPFRSFSIAPFSCPFNRLNTLPPLWGSHSTVLDVYLLPLAATAAAAAAAATGRKFRMSPALLLSWPGAVGGGWAHGSTN